MEKMEMVDEMFNKPEIEKFYKLKKLASTIEWDLKKIKDKKLREYKLLKLSQIKKELRNYETKYPAS